MANALLLKPLPLIAVTASSTAVGYDPIYVGNDYLGVVWRSLAATSVDLIVDLGSDMLCDTAFLFGCDGATAAMTLQVSASTQAAGAGFSSPTWSGAVLPFLAGSEMPSNGRGVAMWQAPTPAPPAARYWRFRIAGLANGAATVGRLALGKGLVLARNFALGAAFGVKDLGSVDFSRYGALLRKRGAKLRTVGISFSSIYKDEVEASVKPLLEQVGNTEPIALITDPTADSMRQRRAYFGPMVGDIGVTWRKATLFQSQANLVSLA
jgi:hypothetical protein